MWFVLRAKALHNLWCDFVGEKYQNLFRVISEKIYTLQSIVFFVGTVGAREFTQGNRRYLSTLWEMETKICPRTFSFRTVCQMTLPILALVT